jgi:hypothetical protein
MNNIIITIILLIVITILVKNTNKEYFNVYGYECEPCPDNSIRSDSGTTGISSCVCKTGFTGSNGETCTIICPANSTAEKGSRFIIDCKCNDGYIGRDGDYCRQCSENTYKIDTNPGRCKNCPANSNSPKGSNLSTDCKCDEGYDGKNGEPCNACSKGLYKNSIGPSPCQPCAKGKYKPEEGAGDCRGCPLDSTTSGSGSIDITDCKCRRGYTGTNGGTCTICDSGKYKDVIGNSDCINCPANSNSPNGSTQSSDCKCDVGFSGPDGGQCTACQAGTYKTKTGSSSCEECDIGKYKPNAGIGYCSSCPLDSTTSASGSIDITDCKCRRGYTGTNGGTCTICESGKYKDVIGDYDCINCPANSNSPNGSDSVEDCLCNMGFVGPDGEDCQKCDANKYKDVIGNFDCTDCPDNSISLAGSQTQTDCKCDNGYTGPDGGQCTACQAGTYKNIIGSDSCEACEAGKYQNLPGQSECSDCPVNMTSNPGSTELFYCKCNVGFTGPDGGQCTACQAGTYKKVIGSDSCEACKAGTYQHLTGQSECSDCPVNKSTTGTGNDSIEDCECNVGYFATGSNCVQCYEGTYKSEVADTDCILCPVNTYSDTRGTITCLNCPSNSNSYEGSTQSYDCKCNAGFSGPDGETCNLCPVNTFKTLIGSSACIQCPDTTISVQGSTSISDCEYELDKPIPQPTILLDPEPQFTILPNYEEYISDNGYSVRISLDRIEKKNLEDTFDEENTFVSNYDKLILTYNNDIVQVKVGDVLKIIYITNTIKIIANTTIKHYILDNTDNWTIIQGTLTCEKLTQCTFEFTIPDNLANNSGFAISCQENTSKKILAWKAFSLQLYDRVYWYPKPRPSILPRVQQTRSTIANTTNVVISTVYAIRLDTSDGSYYYTDFEDTNSVLGSPFSIVYKIPEAAIYYNLNEEIDVYPRFIWRQGARSDTEYFICISWGLIPENSISDTKYSTNLYYGIVNKNTFRSDFSQNALKVSFTITTQGAYSFGIFFSDKDTGKIVCEKLYPLIDKTTSDSEVTHNLASLYEPIHVFDDKTDELIVKGLAVKNTTSNYGKTSFDKRESSNLGGPHYIAHPNVMDLGYMRKPDEYFYNLNWYGQHYGNIYGDDVDVTDDTRSLFELEFNNNYTYYEDVIIQARPGDTLELFARLESTLDIYYVTFWIFLDNNIRYWRPIRTLNSNIIGIKDFTIRYDIPDNTLPGNYGIAVSSHTTANKNVNTSWRAYSLHICNLPEIWAPYMGEYPNIDSVNDATKDTRTNGWSTHTLSDITGTMFNNTSRFEGIIAFDYRELYSITPRVISEEFNYNSCMWDDSCIEYSDKDDIYFYNNKIQAKKGDNIDLIIRVLLYHKHLIKVEIILMDISTYAQTPLYSITDLFNASNTEIGISFTIPDTINTGYNIIGIKYNTANTDDVGWKISGEGGSLLHTKQDPEENDRNGWSFFWYYYLLHIWE